MVIRYRPLLMAFLVSLFFRAIVAPAEDFPLRKGDHICLIGNTLGERMQHDGWLETLIQTRFPNHELVFRNLCFSADELTVRLRSKDFGSPDEWLTRCQADVIFCFFGYNESFGGQAGLPKFENDLRQYLQHLKSQKYNGTSPPRIVLFSPIPHENRVADLKIGTRVVRPGDPNLPDGSENNKRLDLYTRAMQKIAAEQGVRFVDLFHRDYELVGDLTINGIHLNETGNKFYAGEIDDSLFPERPLPKPTRAMETLRQAVKEKNWHWFHRYRTTDGYSIYGGRSHLKFVDGQTNREVAQREMEVLDVMTANRDKKIWAIARGEFDYQVDDSNVPPFIPVKTNKPGAGPNGTHLFLGGEEAIEKMTVHSQMEINLFASEEQFPELASPVQMAFDTKGRLWVAAWPTYPHWQPIVEEMNDKLLIFEDTDGDGRADKCKVWADKLHNPTGFEFYNGGVLVAQVPDIWFLEDTDGDDVCDKRTRVLHGIDSADTHHSANSFVIGPGGALYFQEGTFHHTQVETPYGPPVRSVNAGAYRYVPRTQSFEVYVAYGFANPHGHVFDRWGQDFLTDGTGAVNYFATAFSGRMDYPRKHARMQPFFKQRTRPCPATEILSSTHFPKELNGNYLIANVIGFQGIMNYRMIEKDSGFTAEEVEPIVFSPDPNFRPVDLEIGADGALYFIDWQNPIIGHMQHNLRDPSRDKVHGRVYRVTMKGKQPHRILPIDGEPIETLLDRLTEPEDRVRYRARIELSERPSAKVIAAIQQWIDRLDKSDPDFEHHLLEALWVHQHHNIPTDALLRRVLKSKDYHARAAATRVLCYWRDQVSDPLGLLMQMANDAHPRVRLEAVRAASFFEESRAAEVALQVTKHPRDYYLNYTLSETMKQLEPYWKSAIEQGKPFAAGNPDGIEYILASVSTAELMKLPPSEPVFQALLSRPNIVHDRRHEAAMGLAKLHGTDMLHEILNAVEQADKTAGGEGRQVLADLAHMLTSAKAELLQRHRDRIEDLANDAKRPFTRQLAYVTLMTADRSLDPTWNQAQAQLQTYRDVIDSVSVIPDPQLRAAAHERVAPLLKGIPSDIAKRFGNQRGTSGQYVRIEIPGRAILTLAEVQVYSDGTNIAPTGRASQNKTAHQGAASRAIDGRTDGRWSSKTLTHTPENGTNPWWELDLGTERPIEAIALFNRTDGNLGQRLNNFTITVLDAQRNAVWQKTKQPAPKPSVRYELQGDPLGALRRAAIKAVVTTGQQQAETFRALAGMIKANDERATAVRAITRIPAATWPRDEVEPLVEAIIADISKLPDAQRSTPIVRDTLQLGDTLASLLPVAKASSVRKRLRELGVPVVVIRPVPHEMRYDRTEIYVEAGKPIELIFENVDIMPHNLLIVRPGTLEKVGLEGEKMASDPAAFSKHFVPKVKEVLYHTKLLQPRERDRITFTVPAVPGDYPYVCTFPGHWRKMRGVMHVVPNLDDVDPQLLAASQSSDPGKPTRPFVRKWSVSDLEDVFEHLDQGRDPQRGKQLFTELACVKCHKINGQGGQVGPDLADLLQKIKSRKMAPPDILVELITPSKKIDEKYRVVTLQMVDGTLKNGLIVKETKTELHLAGNPLDEKAPSQPVVVKISDIEERFPSQVSIMPEGLLNTCTKEEILDLLAYVLSTGQAEGRQK